MTCVFTVCGLAFQKGYRLLGWLGILFPFPRLIGAAMPAKPGSQFAPKQATVR